MSVGEPPRVQGVGLVAYLGKGIDLNRAATRVGGYTTSMGSITHDVYDLPASALHPFARDNVPASIASNQESTIFRLYVPVGNHGQITDLGIMNGAYKAPGAPFHKPGVPLYTAPADDAKYHRFAAPRMQRSPQGTGWRDQMDRWQPGPGDRFHVVEID